MFITISIIIELARGIIGHNPLSLEGKGAPPEYALRGGMGGFCCIIHQSLRVQCQDKLL